jgi:hypothetical protein
MIGRDVLNQGRTAMQEVLTLLSPLFVRITPGGTAGKPKMREKTIGFVEKVYGFT